MSWTLTCAVWLHKSGIWRWLTCKVLQISAAVGISCFNASQKEMLEDAISSKAQTSAQMVSVRNLKTKSESAPNTYMTASEWTAISDAQSNIQAATAVVHRMSFVGLTNPSEEALGLFVGIVTSVRAPNATPMELHSLCLDFKRVNRSIPC